MARPLYASDEAKAYIKELEKEIESLKHQLSVSEKALDFEKKAHLYDCKRWADERKNNE